MAGYKLMSGEELGMSTYIKDNKVGKYIVFQGREFGEPLTLWSVTGSSFSESQSGTSGLLSRLGISQHPRSSSSSGQKRKRHRETSSAQPKRPRSKSGRRRLDITDLIKEDDRPEEAIRYSAEQPNATSLMGLTRPSERSLDNRILSCLVISPPERPTHEFESAKSLEACRDTIRAHRSHYQDGNILHRDISENNVILAEAEKEGEPKGLLIDLNLVKGVGQWPERSKTPDWHHRVHGD